MGGLLTLGGGICWGLSGSMGQYLFTNEGMDTRWLVPIRLIAAGLILLIICLVRNGSDITRPFRRGNDLRDLLVYGLGGVVMSQLFYFLTIQLSTAGMATILQDLSPVMILGVECMVHKRGPKLSEILAIVLAMVGIWLITTHGQMVLGISGAALLCGVLCAVCVTIYNCCSRRLLSIYPVILLNAWSFLIGGILMSLVFHIWTIDYRPAPTALFGIAFVVVVGNVMAFSLYMLGVRMIGPSKAILYGFSEPVTAAIVSILYFGTPLRAADVAGFLCIFAMLAMISLSQKDTGK